jgi:hypothetical protein
MNMEDDPLKSVHSFVERAYMRMQAGDILIRCLEDGSTVPIQQMVESLVFAGPRSLNALQETLAETEQHKSQVQDDLHQLLKDLDKSLRSYGVNFTGSGNIEAITGLSPVGFLAYLRAQDIHDDKTQIACMQIVKDSRELIETLSSRYLLLQEIEVYLQDWIWALIIQSLHQETRPQNPKINSFRL